MSDQILRLYPEHAPVALRGLYLRDPLLPPGWGERLFVYSNFVTSLDGRIATPDPRTGHGKVPPEIANPRDWRLFQELAAQADVLLTSGRYLRDLRDGLAQDVLPVSSKPEYADLHAYRADVGLPPQPDVAVMSFRLDFELPANLFEQGRKVYLFTSASLDSSDAARHRSAGAELVGFPDSNAIPAGLVAHLQRAGYRRLYSVTGPRVLQGLAAAGALDALFVTTVHRLIGGEPSTTLLEGSLTSPVDFDLTRLYFDPAAKQKNIAQSLARYDRKR